MKILNLYAGLGGNRKLWGDEHEITAVEINPEISRIYKYYHPKDRVLSEDAHQYLLDHFQEYDFIWFSPPCPSHSRMRRINSGVGERKKPHCYPDMRLYQEILFLTHFFKGNWCVENVISYYDPLIKPYIIGRHYIWSNLSLNDIDVDDDADIKGHSKEKYGIDLSLHKLNHRKDQIVRNCVHPKIGKYILDCAMKKVVTLDKYL